MGRGLRGAEAVETPAPSPALKPVRFSGLAVQDVATARDWFESREPGLGGRFVERVNETVARIEANPFQYPEVIRDAVAQISSSSATASGSGSSQITRS
jgi:hypothetical protein